LAYYLIEKLDSKLIKKTMITQEKKYKNSILKIVTDEGFNKWQEMDDEMTYLQVCSDVEFEDRLRHNFDLDEQF